MSKPTLILVVGLTLVFLIAAALPLARRAVLLLTTKYLVKRRLAWVSLVAVALCTALVLIVLSVMGGWLEMFRGSFKTMTGDLIVSRQSQDGFGLYEEMIAEIEKLPEVEAACPIIRTAGLLSLPPDWKDYVGVVGIPIDRIDRVMKFKESLWLQHDIANYPSEHRMPREKVGFELWPNVPYEVITPNDKQATRRPGMIVGGGAIGVKKDQKTGIPTWPKGMETLYARLTVVPSSEEVGTGTKINATTTQYWLVDGSRTQTPQHDKNIYVPFDQLQRDLNLSASEYENERGEKQIEPARTNEIHIKVKPGVEARTVKPAINKIIFDVTGVLPGNLGGVRVQTWEEQQDLWLNAIEHEITLVTTLFAFISLVAVFMIFCIFYMIVIEKTRDIGILKSVGADAWSVAQIFLTYGATIGFLGGALGLLLGWIVVKNINAIHSAITWATGTQIYNSDVYAFDRLPDQVNVPAAGVIWMIAVFAAVIGAVLPAVRAARLNPVESLRFE